MQVSISLMNCGLFVNGFLCKYLKNIYNLMQRRIGMIVAFL